MNPARAPLFARRRGRADPGRFDAARVHREPW